MVRSESDLLLSIDRHSRETLGFQLQNALREAVRSGRLTADERLPSSRKLATELGVSRGVVQSTYEQLEAEGYLRSVPGSATRVAYSAEAPDRAPDAAANASPMAIDFIPGRPDLRSFPMSDWVSACGEAARMTSAQRRGYGDPRGEPRLREVVASYARRVRGASVHPDDVVVCNGFTQGVVLTLAALRERGATAVAVEDPGHPELPAFVRRAGLSPTYVPIDDQGLVVDELAMSEATAVIVTPAHQTPTGVVLAPERRHELLRWAARVGGLVIRQLARRPRRDSTCVVRRARLVTLTDTGVTLLRQAQPLAAQAANNIFASLTDDEQRTLHQLLARLTED